jgi:nitrate reductase NapAB chaperone NapD
MGVCSYLVIPKPGAAAVVADRLAAISGCEVTAAENRDVLILVTETEGREEERVLRSVLERIEGVLTMVLTFGEIETDARAAASPAMNGAR